MIRAAVLAVRMSLEPIARVDILRYLRVPAIVWVMRERRRERSARCKRRDCRRRTP